MHVTLPAANHWSLLPLTYAQLNQTIELHQPSMVSDESAMSHVVKTLSANGGQVNATIQQLLLTAISRSSRTVAQVRVVESRAVCFVTTAITTTFVNTKTGSMP